MRGTLTPRGKQLLDFIRAHIDEHGYAPSFQEMADHCGYATLSTVHEHLGNLERKGYIRRRFSLARAIEVLPTDAERLAFAYRGLNVDEVRARIDEQIFAERAALRQEAGR